MPRPDEPSSAVAPREPSVPTAAADAEVRFSAGEQAHTVGLTEQRATQIVKQSGNARMIAFLAVLLIVLFIPLYWLYDIGLPVVGFGGRLQAETQDQYVTDVSRGYALFIANCARCHGPQGLGGIGPPLNDQAKLYNVLTPQGLAGNGHLNPGYIQSVLTEGGRMVCGDANSVMPAWLQPKGPLNYEQVNDIIDFITASKDTKFVYQPAAEPPATAAPPVDEQGWRDPSYSPPPDATPVPACWRAPAASAAPGTPAPVTSPGTADNPRVIQVTETGSLSITDASGAPVTQIAVVPGETIQFQVTNSAGFDHDFYVGSADKLQGNAVDGLAGLPVFSTGTQNFTWTVPSDASGLQFACTLPGHYATMHGDIVVQQPGGGSGSPAASASPSPSMSMP